MVDVVLIYVALAPSLLHHNHVGVIYAENSNFRMELVRSVPLYFVAMPQYIITIIEAPFVSAPIHNVVGIRSKPQIPRGTKHVNVHEKVPKEVN
jgi:hypothetical protein